MRSQIIEKSGARDKFLCYKDEVDLRNSLMAAYWGWWDMSNYMRQKLLAVFSSPNPPSSPSLL